jgi:hypothetical protein
MYILNESTAAKRKVPVFLVDGAGNGIAGQAGAVTMKISKNGAAWAAPAGGTTISEITGGQPGSYILNFAAGDFDTLGLLQYQITGTGLRLFQDSIQIEDPLASQSSLDAYGLRLLGLTNENAMIDNITWGSNNLIVLGRVRVFADAAALAAAVPGHANGADSELYRYSISCVDIGSGQYSSYKLSRQL